MRERAQPPVYLIQTPEHIGGHLSGKHSGHGKSHRHRQKERAHARADIGRDVAHLFAHAQHVNFSAGGKRFRIIVSPGAHRLRIARHYRGSAFKRGCYLLPVRVRTLGAVAVIDNVSFRVRERHAYAVYRRKHAFGLLSGSQRRCKQARFILYPLLFRFVIQPKQQS